MKDIAPFRQSDSDNADLRAHGCGPFSMLAALDWATDGDFPPQGRARIDAVALAMFQRSGATLAQFRERGLTLDECQRAWQTFPHADRAPFVMQRRRGVSVVGQLLPQLATGRCVAVVPVRYGAVQDADLGVGSWREGHYVLVFDPRDDSVGVADPLRRRVVRWPVRVLVKAMESFGSNPWLRGRGEAGVITASPSLLTRVRTQRDAARAQRDALKAQVRLLRAQLEAGPAIDKAALVRLRAAALAKAEAAEELAKSLREAAR
jgi:hypothetical protein